MTLQTATKYQRLLDHQTTVILAFNMGFKLEYINPAGEMLLGTGAGRLQGTALDEMFNGQQAFISGVHQALDQGSGFTDRDILLTTPTGKQLRVDCAVTPLSDTGATEGVLLEVIPMDRQLRIYRDENIYEQTSLTRTIVRGLAHEIKNPLGGLRGAAQLLEKELPHQSLKEYTAVIITEADRLQNLVDRMLGPKSLPMMRQTNIHEALERVRQLVCAEVPDKYRFRSDYDPSLPDIYGDPDQLIQALLNIVRNAVQATEALESPEIILRTRPQRQITIGHIRHKIAVKIEVIDNGPGIAEDIKERVFFPLVTGRPEGTGLGLSIAQSLIHQHGGLIEFDSQPGHTRFSIYLPFNSQETHQ